MKDYYLQLCTDSALKEMGKKAYPNYILFETTITAISVEKHIRCRQSRTGYDVDIGLKNFCQKAF